MTTDLSTSATANLPILVKNIPEELRNLRQWVSWKLIQRPNQAKPTKIPLNPNTGANASSTDPETWGTFAEAMTYHQSRHANGTGFVFYAQDPFTGIDLDKCRDLATGIIEPWAQEIIEALNSYSELSPSGKGVHIILKGKLKTPGRKKGQIEMYSQDRFFTITGQSIPDCTATIQDRQEELDKLHDEVFKQQSAKQPEKGQNILRKIIPEDSKLIEHASTAKDGATFSALWTGQWEGLYPSQSEADLALSGKLNFWTGGDKARMDSLFRQSGLYRSKWDQPHHSGGRTYGEGTLEKAMESQLFYQPPRPSKKRSEVSINPDSYHLSDNWNAHRLVFDHGEDILWCEAFKQWYIYDGIRFAADLTREIERRAERTVAGFYELAGTLPPEDRRRMAEWAISSESRHRLVNMIESAKRMTPIEPAKFDKNPMLFNVASGTIDLRSQKLLPHI